ncbi:MAG: hypothetical protein GX951_00135 [Mollicutes bacterium]|nr:hypothetical protein [Mollicutes bacterium]
MEQTKEAYIKMYQEFLDEINDFQALNDNYIDKEMKEIIEGLKSKLNDILKNINNYKDDELDVLYNKAKPLFNGIKEVCEEIKGRKKRKKNKIIAAANIISILAIIWSISNYNRGIKILKSMEARFEKENPLTINEIYDLSDPTPMPKVFYPPEVDYTPGVNYTPIEASAVKELENGIIGINEARMIRNFVKEQLLTHYLGSLPEEYFLNKPFTKEVLYGDII